MVARVTYSKNMLKWSNAVKSQDLSDWPKPSSSFKGLEQTNLGELKPDIPTAIDETVFAWINQANLEKTTIERRLAEIEKKMNCFAEIIEPKEVTIRDIPYAQANKEITEYFKTHHGESIDPADLEENLGIDIEIAIKICEKLEKEGKIRGV